MNIFARIFTPAFLAEMEQDLTPLLNAGLAAIPGNAAFSPLETMVLQGLASAAITSASAKVTAGSTSDNVQVSTKSNAPSAA